jgi:hypothetical protein
VSGAAEDRICLVVVFNHRYDRNIEKLVALYRERFEHVRFLVPAYTGARPDTVCVLENAVCFQGYFWQAFPRYHDPRFTHYVFIGDDVLLARDVGAANLAARLGLDDRSGYIKSLIGLTDGSYKWVRGCDAIACVNRAPGLARYADLLPAPAEFSARLARHGLPVQRHFTLRNMRKSPSAAAVNAGGRYVPYRGGLRDLLTLAPPIGLATALAAREIPLLSRAMRKNLERRTLPVPFASGYSDFVVVPAGAVAEFARICGVFAAMNLFVEVAIPTALALTVERIRTEADTGARGLELWRAADVAALEERCGRSVARLPEGYLYTHPVKLSRWTL